MIQFLKLKFPATYEEIWASYNVAHIEYVKAPTLNSGKWKCEDDEENALVKFKSEEHCELVIVKKIDLEKLGIEL